MLSHLSHVIVAGAGSFWLTIHIVTDFWSSTFTPWHDLCDLIARNWLACFIKRKSGLNALAYIYLGITRIGSCKLLIYNYKLFIW